MEVERGTFLPEDHQALKNAGLVVCTLTGMTYAELKRGDMKFKIAEDLEQELLQDREKNRSHTNEVAFPSGLFLPNSSNEPLAIQDNLVREYVEDLRGRYRLKAVDGGISRLVDYGEIILQHLREGVRLLERGSYPYLSARTRTRAFPETVGVQNYVADIGPFDPDGLNVHILGRDEGDPEIGVWPLLWPNGGH